MIQQNIRALTAKMIERLLLLQLLKKRKPITEFSGQLPPVLDMHPDIRHDHSSYQFMCQPQLRIFIYFTPCM